MSNNKAYIMIITAVVLFAGCRIKTIPFNDTKIDIPFFRNIAALSGIKKITDFDSVTIYQAVLREELVERDGLPEYKLINEASDQTRANLADRKNYHNLYLCQVYTGKKRDTLCVFIASSFNVKDRCTKLGPAYLGIIRMDEITIKKALKIKSKDTSFIDLEGKPQKDTIYFISDTTKNSMQFITNWKIPSASRQLCSAENANDSLCSISIKEIINRNVNKIGGEKATIYPIQKIFNDPHALIFKYYKTIIKPKP